MHVKTSAAIAFPAPGVLPTVEHYSILTAVNVNRILLSAKYCQIRDSRYALRRVY